MACKICDRFSHAHKDEDKEHSRFIIIRLILGAVLFALGYLIKIDILFIISYIILGYDVVINAFRDIKHIFNEHFLMTVATAGAMAIGSFGEAAAVMLFYQFGEFLSDIAVDKSKESIGELMDLRSDTANLLKDGNSLVVSSKDIKIGDIIRVLPGEKIPLDGTVIKGSALLDTKSLTGEAVLKRVSEGDAVLSGTICTESVIDICVTTLFENSTASKILALVNDEKKSKSEKFITKFARIYTPIVVFLAVLIMLVPQIFGGGFKEWFYRAMLFLVVSCPCALVVSVPLSFFAGLGCASKKGILLKGASALENASKIKTAAFDKTGTLTYGEFTVQSVRSSKYPKYIILKYAAYCEYFSKHPIAKAISEVFEEEIDESLISDYKEYTGLGVCAKVESHIVRVGSSGFIENAPSVEKAVFVSIDGEYAGYLEICDKIKDNVLKISEDCKKLGINTVILSGDSHENTKSVSDTLNMDFYSELLPQDKIEKINELKKSGFVAFLGDGINDAPALSVANLGISMGQIGSDAAVLASDACFMADNPGKIFDLLKISRKTMKIVKENIFFAISIKIIIMILGALGIASMWLAVFADVGVCLLAILNALRAFYVKD